MTRSHSFFLVILSVGRVGGQYLPSTAYEPRGPIFGDRNWGNGTDEGLMRRDGGNQDSTSTAMYLVSHDDFCLFGPTEPNTAISDSKMKVVSWCTKDDHGTRLIPDGILRGVTYVKAPSWVQVSGTGDLTKINIQKGDQGGQFDSSKHTPDGAQMYISDDKQTASSWVTLISDQTFCVRACTGDPKFCPTKYDEMGCYFLTSNGVGWDGSYQDCEADDGDPPGVMDGTTYTQGNTPVPSPTIPPVSNCKPGSSAANGQTAAAGSGSEPGSGSGGGSSTDGNGDAGGSTSWVPMPTCVPCTSASASTSEGSASKGDPSTAARSDGGSTPTATPTSSSPGSESTSSGGTEQVGITQLSSVSQVTFAFSSGKKPAGGGGTALSLPPSPSPTGLNGHGGEVGKNHGAAPSQVNNTAAAPSSSQSPGTDNDDDDDDLSRRGWLLDSRDDNGGTTTSNGQCCFTTWTPSVVSGAQKTGTSDGESKSAATNGSASVTGTKTDASSAGTGTGAGSHPITTTGSRSVVSGTLRAGNGTVGGNSSKAGNGTNGSSAALRVVIVGLGEGDLVRLVWLGIASGIGMLLGGLTLV
ncbi:hypothetical protein IAR55_003799 [Kwoniella newhampshirensis]|uniref:Uncharacterized protein n=1 Tax=Kwoniella newhampshirensis TaxID=1651941 RepID=A0AAW0YLR8_9TREE